MYCRDCGFDLPDSARFCPGCGSQIGEITEEPSDIPMEAAVPVVEAATDKLTFEQTQAYLQQAKDLAVTVYICQQTEEQLQFELDDLETPETENVPKRKKRGKAVTIWMIFASIVAVVNLNVLLHSQTLDLTTSGMPVFHGPSLSQMLSCVLMNGVYICAPLLWREAKYQIARRKWKMQNESSRKRDGALIESVKRQRDWAGEQEQKAAASLKQLYDLDIIYIEYRSLIPIITLFQYFESGRCHTLNGEHGAYELYQSKVRYNIIRERVDDVLANMEQVRKNQPGVFREITEANRIVNDICREAYGLTAAGKKNEENTVAAAFEAKVTAQNRVISQYLSTPKERINV